MQSLVTPQFERELRKRMSLIRLAKRGFFRRLASEDSIIEREILLYRAVLDKALIDSFSLQPSIKKDVDDWLVLDNIDFILCCEYAELEPELVFNTFKIMKRILRGENARFKKFGASYNTESKGT